jgi:transcriptional regulator with XRE-family HTH domain
MFSSNLLRLMTKKGVTVIEMEKDLNIEAARIRRWTQATCYPQMAMLIKVCNYFNYFDIYTLLTEPINFQ